jgi:C1A family cysteine protease
MTSPETRRPSGHGGYGWVPDLPDARDHLYAAPPEFLAALPAQVDLRDQCPAVYDQGQLGSCTANAIGGAFEFDLLRQKAPDFVPSRLFVYYNERVQENTVGSDAGAQIRDGIKSVAKLGVCAESEWPYDIGQFTVKPSAQCYTDALTHRVTSYQRVAQLPNQLKGCLAHGNPFVFGITVYESFESEQVAKTGEVPMPGAGEQVLGGHAILAVGYDDSTQRFTVRNSWGTGWGIGGYFTIPYAYLIDRSLASDFWTLLAVTG